MDRKLIDYLPDILRNILEFRQIMGAEQPELEAFWGKGNKVVDNSFILSEDEDAASRWEKILNISHKDTDELDVKMVPANMTLEVLLWYTTHRMLEIKTHGALEQYTHRQMTELDLR